MLNRHTVVLFLSFLVLLLIYETSFHLVILTLFFLAALLNVFKSPTSELWLLAVVTSEYSIIFAGLISLLLLTNFYAVSFTLVGTILGLTALVLFLLPIRDAYFIAQKLPSDLEKAFRQMKNVTIKNDQKLINKPFNIFKLFQTIPKVSFRTLTYVTYDDATLTLDFYGSVVTGKRPCVIVIHGGSWIGGNSKQLSELNRHLAQAGYHCAAINYRLAPQWKCPAPIEDTAAALTYLRQHADELNIDQNNFVLLGRSAGGQIALLAAYTVQQSGIKGVINFYGPADMIWGYMTPTNPLVPIEDTAAALTYLRQHADELNIDQNNFVLLGRSAGGQIALLAAYTVQQSGIKGVINFYGPADMIWGYMTPTNPLVLDSRQTLARYIGGDYFEMPDKYAASSPIEFVNRQTVPTLTFHGLTDSLVFYEHSRRLDAKLHQNDVPHYYLELPWATHGFDYNLNGPGGQLSTYAIDYFLNVVTNQQ
ncbi:unnamed protein product [Rotaria sordida]|uniref:BD-FAE-like domain-containing protein n=1 Tax=Rotaria sordida TaxID=392033 RepID=A0A814IZ32_9BILA|nr:unnamed protein product [Rotaria sordida]